MERGALWTEESFGLGYLGGDSLGDLGGLLERHN